MQPSPLYQRYPALFLIAAGSWMTYCSGYLNLASTSGMKYDPIYYDPYVFLLIGIFERHEVITKDLALFLFTV